MKLITSATSLTLLMLNEHPTGAFLTPLQVGISTESAGTLHLIAQRRTAFGSTHGTSRGSAFLTIKKAWGTGRKAVGVNAHPTECRREGSRPVGMEMKMKGRGGTMEQAIYLEIEQDADWWKLDQAAEVLRAGGLGVVPTDTCYTFACDVHSRRGVERIFELKNMQGQKKPLSLLCRDLATISKYTNGIDKARDDILKGTLPGPFTYILPATNEVPRVLLEHKHHKKTWKRREIGVRMPENPVLLELLRLVDTCDS
ncbi:unnamed protein product [Discosporangium mesarthrocarpum]